MASKRSRPLLPEWAHHADWPLTGAAVAFLIAYAYSVLAQPHGSARTVTDAILWLTWLCFALDYVVRLYRAENRLRWFLYNLHEFVIVALPMLRPLRLLRLVTLISAFQRSVGGALRGRVVAYACGGSALLVFVAALAVLEAERVDPSATITRFPDALWWAAATVTTVGYGDYSPVTTTGRVIAVGLMIAGIALLGVVTATLASWLAQRVAADDAQSQLATREHVDALTAEIVALRAELRQLGERMQ
ncbi:potassium channel family protein [Antrihabitans cavernicola]|uniref:potassium channel family protein n=1 Tax=Antrihabitans cavernicola TaxID=2495913 RepID=UPI001F2EAD1A|nr:potassium channel family protein [Spelaeibacter cavernicola]